MAIYLDVHKNYTLTEMRQARPQFFKNGENAERYNVRKNHLIVTDLVTMKVTVWQFHWVDGTPILSPVWYPEHEDRGGYRNVTAEEVVYAVEKLLHLGRLPIHPVDGHNYSGYRIEEQDWRCPACDQLNLYDVTIEDHGVCYCCHKEMLHGERCRGCYAHYQEGCTCEEEEPEGYFDYYDPATRRWILRDNHPALTNAERNA